MRLNVGFTVISAEGTVLIDVRQQQTYAESDTKDLPVDTATRIIDPSYQVYPSYSIFIPTNSFTH